MKTISFKVVIFSIGCSFASPIQSDEKVLTKPTNQMTNEISSEEAEIVDLTNKERKKKGLKPLKTNKILTMAAREQSASMARHHHLSHSVNGKNFAYRIKESGYPYRHVGENVARSKRSAPHVIDMWMKSHGHRVNILNPQFEEIGIGIAPMQHGDKYYTQIYGAQK